MRFTPAVMTNSTVLSPTLCGEIIHKYSQDVVPAGVTGKAKLNTTIRQASAKPIPIGDIDNLYEDLLSIALRVNHENWGFTLDDHDPIQFLKYTVGGHYNWHLDMGAGKHFTRKLSFIVGLTPTESYEGGEVVFKAGSNERSFKIPQGQMILFPSYILHKVTPVTKGERCVLVGWLRGEKPFQ